MNITEKILSKKAGKEVNPGEIIEVDVDLAMSHDGTSPPAIKTFEKVADGKATKIIIPSNLQNLAGMVSAFAELNEKSGTVGKE